MATEPHQPTREDLLAVLTFSRGFDAPGFVAGRWVHPEPAEDGVIVLGYWVPSEDVLRWQEALYERHVTVPFDWSASAWSRRMRHYYEDPDLLKRARLLTVRKVLTTLLRADRFCEGYLGEAFERGVPQAAMRRLKRLAR